jgi:uncharacterized protein YggE
MPSRRALAGLAILLALLAGAGCAPAAALEDRPPPTIVVRGTGKVTLKPDTAVVHVGAEQRAPSLADASTEVARRMREVLARMKALGVAERDITTIAYSVSPVAAPRRPEDDTVRILGYHVANVVQVKIRDLDAVGRIMDGAMAAGANTVGGLVFTVDDRSRPEAEARGRAVKAAAEKARQLADAAGVKLGDLLSLTEEAGPRPIYERVGAPYMAASAASAPGPVESGQLDIVVSVEAHYRIGR